MFSATVIGDVLRTIALATGGGSLAMAVLVTFIYGRRYVRDWRLARVQGEKLAWRGLLPLHVILVAFSHSTLVVLSLTIVYTGLGDPVTWRTALIAVASVTSAVAMWALLRWQRRLYPRHDEEPPVVALRDPPEQPPETPAHGMPHV